MLRYWLIDDLYAEDEYGSSILSGLKHARRLNFWIGKTLRPYLGDRVLEVGAGIATLTSQFIPRELYVATDSNPHCLRYLQSFSIGKPYLHVHHMNPNDAEHFDGLQEKFDTALVVNILDRVEDDQTVLRNVWSALQPGGRALVFVPQNPHLFGELDTTLRRRERYTRAKLEQSLTAAGFEVQEIFDFNRFSVPGWWFNGKLLRRNKISRLQLKAIDVAMPVLSRIDTLCPWKGLSLIGIGIKN